jgi:hypothetical protein
MQQCIPKFEIEPAYLLYPLAVRYTPLGGGGLQDSNSIAPFSGSSKISSATCNKVALLTTEQHDIKYLVNEIGV